MDSGDLVWAVSQTVTPDAVAEYQTAFDTSMTFGLLMLAVGIVAGLMAGYGLHKILSRGEIWPEREQ